MRKLLALSYVLCVAGFACLAHAQLTQTGAGKGGAGGGGGGGLSVDQFSHFVGPVTVAGSANYTGQNITSGANLLVVMLASASNNALTTPILTWDNTGTPQAMTAASGFPYVTTNVTGQQSLGFWSLLNPHTGVGKTLNISLGVGQDIYISAISFNSATSIPNTATFSSSSTATVNSITLTSAPNHIGVAMFNTDQGYASANGTTIALLGGGSFFNAAANYLPGNSPTIVLTATNTIAANFTAGAVDVQ